MTQPTPNPVRLARYLAGAGLGSRRACEDLIRSGVVAVNDTTVDTPACNVIPGKDIVLCDGKLATWEHSEYWLLYKPPGYTCSAKDPHARHLVTELFPKESARLFTVGRLDRDSEGLILCTNDGKFAQQIAHPSHQVPKEYRVWVTGTVTPSHLQQLRQGITDHGDVLRAISARVAATQPQTTIVELVVSEGKKREIRRMCSACKWEVQRLVRTRIGPLVDPNLRPGTCRLLTTPELAALRAAAEL